MKANRSIERSKDTAYDLNPVLITLILSVLIIIPQYLLGLIVGLGKNIKVIDDFFTYMDTNNMSFLLIIYSTALTLFFAYIFARKILKRDKISLGLVDDRKFISYIKGILLGFSLISLIVLILKSLGFADIVTNKTDLNIKLFLIFIPAWMIQGFEEEFLMRSILMNQIAGKASIYQGIFANSLIFSILHLGNLGFNLMSFINLFMVGLIFSLIFYKEDSIYMSAAAHSFWNMTMANIYGIRVSGFSQSGANILKTTLKGSPLISGAEFGLEGSIITSLVLVGVLIILISNIRKKSCTK